MPNATLTIEMKVPTRWLIAPRRFQPFGIAIMRVGNMGIFAFGIRGLMLATIRW